MEQVSPLIDRGSPIPTVARFFNGPFESVMDFGPELAIGNGAPSAGAEPLSLPAPLRMEPQLPLLEALDLVVKPTSKPVKDAPEQEEQGPKRPYYIVGNPYGRTYEPANDEDRNRDALRQLKKHFQDREDYVDIAGSRLQAVAGLSIGLPFELPALDGSPKMNAKMARVFSWLMCGYNPAVEPGLVKLPSGMLRVDSKTGSGLREFLMACAERLGHQMVECTSISIYDCTPDMKNCSFNNELLHHLASGKTGKVEAYKIHL